MKKLCFTLPSAEEQQRITNSLMLIEKKIDLLDYKIENLKLFIM